MKKLLITLFFVCSGLLVATAQHSVSTTAERTPKLILGTEIGFQWFNISTRFSSLRIEIPVNRYQHVGLRFSSILSGTSNDYSYDYGYNTNLEQGSFEIGIDGKFFPHGKFTGRKSGFYVGTDLRFGTRMLSSYIYDFQTNATVKVTYKHSTAKILFNWGVQWRFGKHVVFDLGAPIGIEYYQTKDPRYTDSGSISQRNLTMMPTIMMGYAF